MSWRTIQSWAGILLAFCLFVAPLLQGRAEAADSLHGAAAARVAVARVNGREISLATLMARMRQIRAAKYGTAKLTEAFGDRLKKEALEKLILEEVAFQDPERRQVTVDEAEVDAFIAKESRKHRDRKHFEKFLEIMGYTPETYREHARRMVMIQEVIDRDINQKIDDVPEEVAKAYYARNRFRFVQPELVEVTDIVFFVDPQSSEGRKEVEAVKARLEGELGGDPGKLPPSDLYYVQPNLKLSKVKTPVLYEAARVLEPNAISDVVEEDGTLHILKLTGYRPFQETTFEQALPRIKQELLAKRRREALDAWLADLRAKAEVEIFDVQAR